jgi:hypothetical protein
MTEADGSGTQDTREAWSTRRCAVVLGVWLLSCSTVFCSGVWLHGHPGGRLFTAERADAQQEIWFLGFAAHALSHLQHPFLTNLMYAGQGGVNTLSNTSELAVGVLFAPVTWIAGPIVTFNLVTLLAPVATGLVTFWSLQSVTRRRFGQCVAATMVAFAPNLVAAAVGGHLMVTLFIYPPIVFALMTDLLVTKRRSDVRNGIWLGLATAVQFFIGTELLVISVTVTAVALLVVWVLAPRRSVPWGGLFRAGSWAVGIAGVLLAYPLWFALAGPQHVTGPAWPIILYANHHPGDIVGIGHGGVAFTASGIGLGINTTYLGWALLTFLAVSAPHWRGRTPVVLAATGVVSWLLSLGSPAQATGFFGTVSHPMRLLDHLPLFDAVIAARFDLGCTFCAALLLAFSIDGWAAVVAERWERNGRAERVARIVVATAAIVACLPVVATYRIPSAAPVHEPWWFAARASTLHPGGNVTVYPNYQTLMWEAVQDFPFPITGGYAIIPGTDGTTSQAFEVPRPLDAVLLRAEVLRKRPTGLDLTDATLPDALATLKERSVSTVVVLTKEANAGYVAATFTSLLGRGPTVDHRVMVWHHVQAQLPDHPVPGAAAAIATCAWRWHRSAADAVRCSEIVLTAARHLGA